jgi:hypothetical protein
MRRGGRTDGRYEFPLPRRSSRITWLTDPPGNTIGTPGLRVTTPTYARRSFTGVAETAAGSQHLSAAISTAAPPAFETLIRFNRS